MIFSVMLTDSVIELDDSLSVEERIQLCQKIIDLYPDDFLYEIPREKPKTIELDHSEKVKQRLRIMGEYIYQASPIETSGSVISKYRERMDRQREVVMEIKN